MSKKVKAPSILIATDFFTKPRNRIWISKEGGEAVVVLQLIWIECSQARGYKLPVDEIQGIAMPMPISPERVKEIAESACAVGLLETDGEFYFNSQIIENNKNFEAKQLNYQKARARRDVDSGRILPESSQNPATILGESSEDCGRIIVNVNTIRKGKDPNLENSQPGKTKISEFVHLSDIEREDVLMEFKRFGLEEKHMLRACTHLDRWLAEPLNASKRRYAALHLKTWGLKEVMKDQSTKNDLEASQNRRKGIKANADPPRPRSKTVDEIMQEQLGK